MSLVEKSVTARNETADELATDGATLDGGNMAQIRASAVQQRREKGSHGVAVRSKLSQSGGGMARL